MVGDQPDVPAAAAVAPVGAAPGHVGLPAERHRAGPTVAGPDVDLGLVDEGSRSGHNGPAYAGLVIGRS